MCHVFVRMLGGQNGSPADLGLAGLSGTHNVCVALIVLIACEPQTIVLGHDQKSIVESIVLKRAIDSTTEDRRSHFYSTSILMLQLKHDI